jgi:hypothetical protein
MKNRVFFIIVLFLCSCTENESPSDQDGKIVSAIAANGQTEAELKESLEEIEREEQERANSRTTMSFDKTAVNFGTIKEDTDNKASFIVKNTGTKPLIIEKVDVSCGCTTASKPEKPILPGMTDKIDVVFHPHEGQLDQQNKTVTITANTDPKIAVLTIEAFVEKK